MSVLTPDPAQGAALYSGAQAFYTHDDAGDKKDGGGNYVHEAREFSAHEAEAICDWARYINALAAASPRWVKVTLAHTDFQDAALTKTTTLRALAAGEIVQMTKIKHSTAFAGTSITGYTLSVGVAGRTVDALSPAFEVLQAVSGTAFDLSQIVAAESHTASVNLEITATSVGANLDQSTAGVVDVWLLISKAI